MVWDREGAMSVVCGRVVTSEPRWRQLRSLASRRITKNGRRANRSANCFPQNCLVRAAPGAAPRELAVYDHTRQASNAVLLRPRCDVCLMHVVNFDVVV